MCESKVQCVFKPKRTMVATAVGIEGTFGDGEDKPLWELSDAHSTKLRNWNLRTAALSVVSDSLDHSWN